MKTTLILAALCLTAMFDNAVGLTQYIESRLESARWEGQVITDPPTTIFLDIPLQHHVTITVYNAEAAQTDDTPHIMASGVHINIELAHTYRYCALSRDLLRRWGGPFDYGDVIYIHGTDDPSLEGYWIVQDTMNERFTNRVDLLVGSERRLGKSSGLLVLAE